jgi:hypothetical protein
LSVDPGEQATIIGIGLAAMFGFGSGIWKAASIRGDVNAKWARRVDFATAALDEKTIAELEGLRDDVSEVLPEGPFDPKQAITDPAVLLDSAERATDLHRVRVRMDSCVGRLMLVGRLTVAALTVLIVGTVAATAHFAELVRWDPLKPIALVLLGAGVVVLTLVGGAYIVLQDQLATGEQRAGTAGRAEEDG